MKEDAESNASVPGGVTHAMHYLVSEIYNYINYKQRASRGLLSAVQDGNERVHTCVHAERGCLNSRMHVYNKTQARSG